MLSLGIVGSSRQENERRVPVYPEHFPQIAPTLRKFLRLETGYGRSFGLSDSYFAPYVKEIASREALFRNSDALVLPKPTAADLREMTTGQVLCGWTHSVQQVPIAQAAIDRRLTLISWENMHQWLASGEKGLHVFWKNNELAGYAAVLHALELQGIDGFYGPRRKVVILSYGSVSRGAVFALHGRGFNNIHVFTKRPVHLVGYQHPDVYHAHYFRDDSGKFWVFNEGGERRPLITELAEADIVVNGTLQNVTDPLMFVRPAQVRLLKPRSLVIDISCDAGMGFCFARPTTFNAPTFTVGDGITYYSVDHTPSYLWNAASREISRSFLPYLSCLLQGPRGWAREPTLRKAVDIDQGRVLNESLLRFQRRARPYPHHRLGSRTRRSQSSSPVLPPVV